MGYLHYDNGQFDLTVSFRFAASESDLAHWQAAMAGVSELLFAATHGQMRIRRVYWLDRCAGSEFADAFIVDADDDTSAQPGGGDELGMRMRLTRKYVDSPFQILHEFGHYAFGLSDEYANVGGAEGDNVSHCVPDPQRGFCIMSHMPEHGDKLVARDGGWDVEPGPVRAFCAPWNHNAVAPTSQNTRHGDRSCWETIQERYPDVSIPLPWPEVPVADADNEPPEWRRLRPGCQILVLGSGSDCEQRGVRSAMEFWHGYQARDDVDADVRFGVVGDESGETELDAWPTIGAAMRTVFGARGAHHVARALVLLPGVEPEDPDQVAGDVAWARANRVHVVALARSPRIDDAVLLDFVTATDGRLDLLPPPAAGDAADNGFVVQSALIGLAGSFVDGHGTIASTAGTLPAGASASAPAPSRGYTPMRTAELTDHLIFVEEGAQRLTLVLSTLDCGAADLELCAPGTAPAAGDAEHAATAAGHITWAAVPSPRPGFWIARIRRVAAADRCVPYRLFAFSYNPQVTVQIAGLECAYHLGDRIRLDLNVDVEAAARRRPDRHAAASGQTPGLHRPVGSSRTDPDGAPREMRPFRPIVARRTVDATCVPLRQSLRADTAGTARYEFVLIDSGVPPHGSTGRTGAYVRTVAYQIHVLAGPRRFGLRG